MFLSDKEISLKISIVSNKTCIFHKVSICVCLCINISCKHDFFIYFFWAGHFFPANWMQQNDFLYNGSLCVAIQTCSHWQLAVEAASVYFFCSVQIVWLFIKQVSMKKVFTNFQIKYEVNKVKFIFESRAKNWR